MSTLLFFIRCSSKYMINHLSNQTNKIVAHKQVTRLLCPESTCHPNMGDVIFNVLNLTAYIFATALFPTFVFSLVL